MKQIICVALVASVVALALGLTSCATAPDAGKDKTLDLATAKGIAMAMEDETAALIPADNITSQTQQRKVPLLGCGDDEYKWSGRTTVTFAGEVDPQEVIDTITAAWRKKAGVTVDEVGDTKGKDAEVDMTVAEGGFYNAAIWEDGTQLWVTSFSPCFHLEGGREPGEEY